MQHRGGQKLSRFGFVACIALMASACETTAVYVPVFPSFGQLPTNTEPLPQLMLWDGKRKIENVQGGEGHRTYFQLTDEDQKTILLYEEALRRRVARSEETVNTANQLFRWMSENSGENVETILKKVRDDYKGKSLKEDKRHMSEKPVVPANLKQAGGWPW